MSDKVEDTSEKVKKTILPSKNEIEPSRFENGNIPDDLYDDRISSGIFKKTFDCEIVI